MSAMADVSVPKNSEWGPALWEVLHGILERVGKTPHQYIRDDQQREVLHALRMLDVIMPCALCRKHYQECRLAKRGGEEIRERYSPGSRLSQDQTQDDEFCSADLYIAVDDDEQGEWID